LKELRIEPTPKNITMNPCELEAKKERRTIVSSTGENFIPSTIQTPEN
jgi:hypothetical protein